MESLIQKNINMGLTTMGVVSGGSMALLPLFKFLQVFLSLRSQTSYEVPFYIVEGDNTHVWNLTDTTKLGLVMETNYHMKQGVALLSLVAAGMGEVMAPNNLSKQKNPQKGQHNLVTYEHDQLSNKFDSFHKKVHTHDVPFDLFKTNYYFEVIPC